MSIKGIFILIFFFCFIKIKIFFSPSRFRHEEIATPTMEQRQKVHKIEKKKHLLRKLCLFFSIVMLFSKVFFLLVSAVMCFSLFFFSHFVVVKNKNKKKEFGFSSLKTVTNILLIIYITQKKICFLLFCTDNNDYQCQQIRKKE